MKSFLTPEFDTVEREYQERLDSVCPPPKEQALRYNSGKKKWSLVDFKSLEPMVDVLEFGANKYAPFNWTKGMPVTEVSESLLRHMFAFLSGENKDLDSNCDHLGHIMANAMFLSYIMREQSQYDDRKHEAPTK